MSMTVKANIITCTKEFLLNPVFQNPKGRSLFALFTTTVGYHGTSEGRMGDQIIEGKFANADRRIYVADKETATAYALKASRDGTKPLVLKIYSTTKAIFNESSNNSWSGVGDKGAYQYFPPGPTQDVFIEKGYEVKDHN